MNQSSLFSIDDSTVWNPNVKLRLSISEDQLNMLQSLQEWNKIQDKNTRIEKDSLIGNSQPQNSIPASQSNEKIKERNIELFNEHQQHQRSKIKICNIHKTKLTRSRSLSDINNADRSVSDSNIFLKRSSSLSSVYHFSQIKCTKESNCNNCSPKKHLLLHYSKKLFNFLAVKSKNSFYNRGITSENMEVVSQSPVTISSNTNKVVGKDTDFIAVEEKIISSPQHCNDSLFKDQSVSSAKGLVKHDTSSSNDVKKSVESHVSVSCENNSSSAFDSLKETVLINTHKEADSSQLHDDKKKCADDKNVEIDCKTVFTSNDICSIENNSINLNTEKPIESLASTSCKTTRLHTVEEKMTIDANSVAVKIIDTDTTIQKVNEIPNECIKPKVTAEEPSYNKSSQSNNKNVYESSNKLNEKMDVSENAQKVHKDTEISITGKRKSNTKLHRSKKLKSVEKQELKVRSIKNAAEICYCADNVEDMLQIIKLLL